MGGGSWTRKSFSDYSRLSKNCTLDSMGTLNYDGTAQELFKSKRIQPELNPHNVMRECCDSEEHPNSVPVIIGLDTTGSMSSAGLEVAKKINVIITELYKKYTDIEIMIMGIGDLAYDTAPIQISQFESDIRIAEQLDKIYMERGGGGNGFESYTLAWYFGLRHTKLDCWDRGKKGIIITTGDEPLNPYLPANRLNSISGDSNESDIETKELYNLARNKFDIYHIAINDRVTGYSYYENRIKDSFGTFLDTNHLKVSTLDELAQKIIECIDNSLANNDNYDNKEKGGISW